MELYLSMLETLYIGQNPLLEIPESIWSLSNLKDLGVFLALLFKVKFKA